VFQFYGMFFVAPFLKSHLRSRHVLVLRDQESELGKHAGSAV
jgi:hypothetical protein